MNAKPERSETEMDAPKRLQAEIVNCMPFRWDLPAVNPESKRVNKSVALDLGFAHFPF
jgi:hypothetical protein